MEQYDCHSEISCLDKVIRVGAFAQPAAAATASSGSHLLPQQHPTAAAAEHALPSNDDHWFDHVSEQNTIEREAASTWPPHHIDLTQSVALLRAAFERKEELILDHFLRRHSLPSALTTR
ncbi:hypothetical protein TYRP_013516 [Tyrophagus putrescentiae]|nr:hypothetical protein TYRP_013516 [Tyrophagus putrescentiae]